MSDRIKTPYEFAFDEKRVISNHFNDYHDWDKDVFDPIKKKLISHLRKEQSNSCCYCKRELGFDIKEVDIEHIIPKSVYSKFTFQKFNLALSCPACNTKKGAKPVLVRDYVKYPSIGKAFTIIHAHYDNYNEHILIADGALYCPRSAKGSDTIKYCGLYRLTVVLEKTREYQAKKSGITELVEGIRTATEQDIIELLDVLKEKLGIVGTG